MNTLLTLSLVFVAGGLLSLFFFAGLLFTVRLTIKQGLQSSFTGLWLIISFLLRSTLVIGLLYWIGQNQWPRIAVAMLGFIIMRFVLLHWLGTSSSTHPPLKNREVRHAP